MCTPLSKAVLQDITPCVTQVKATIKELTIGFVIASTETDIAALALKSIGYLEQITESDYQDIVGLLEEERCDESMSITEEFQKRINYVKHENYKIFLKKMLKIYDIFQSESTPVTRHRAFVIDLLLFVRTVYPTGVNILNPKWDEDEEFCIGADEAVKLHILNHNDEPQYDSGWIEIIPKGDRTDVAFVFYLSDAKNVCNKVKGNSIRNGESTVVGRKLKFKKLFGVHLENNYGNKMLNGVQMEMSPEIPSESRFINWSRGGLLIVRERDRVFFFDRGCRWYLGLEDIENQNYQITYKGVTKAFDDGRNFSFGISENKSKPTNNTFLWM